MTRELARLIAGHVFLHACMAGMRMASPLLALREGYSEAAVGVLLALYALMQVFLALPAGRYADRHGLKRPVGWSVIAAAGGAAMAVAWPIFPVLCVSALLTGGATGAAVIALQRHVGRAAQTPTQLKQVFSWLSIGPAFSNFLGPFVAGLVIDHAGFRWAFFVMAVLPLVAWAWIRGAHELPLPQRPANAAPSRAWDLVREPMFRRLLIVNWFLSSAWDVHTFVVPVLGHERGLSASVIGTILGAFAIAAAAVRVLLPVIAAKVREWAMVAGAMVATALIYAVYPLMHTAVAMGVCSVLLGIALGCVQPMIMSMLHQITPHHRHGEAVGMRLMVINASSVAMPMLFGAAGTVVGISAVFWTMAVMVGAGSRLAAGLRGDRRS
ncbi:MFS transporter [Ramlibacter montanisoli]|uniref:MFS transporter n=1 Tax=Ramlibacter montanisoli TaxID=2732512 RepID=A0A849K4W4_9BURK|nr:MFS transporter [Ramlibacter montanisoli]NNU42660.1 MFS transporter [Ramlibacter montanisoli]